jgi:hypothetical protein
VKTVWFIPPVVVPILIGFAPVAFVVLRAVK